MLAVTRTFTLDGIAARCVGAEVDVGRGLASFSLVGLPDAAVRESRERVRAAIINAGFEFPLRRITASLAPADLRKAGPGFDLAIAAAVLVASGQLPGSLLSRLWLAGELGLDGSIRPVPGVLAMAEEARRAAAEGIAVPAGNAPEAALVEALDVFPLRALGELRALAQGEMPPLPGGEAARPAHCDRRAPDLADLRGQPGLRRALEIAAAGGHSLLVVGPPGAGKSLAGARLPGLLPPLDRAEAVEVTRIASACGRPPPPGSLSPRPFRSPHHTISAAGLVGGGTPPRAGEVTMAHRGVLFLDELAEFSRPALEALRQPLEDGRVTIVRAGHRLELPCRFMLVAASNPCPCGRGRDDAGCRCPEAAVRRYEAKLSGALADRIDLVTGVSQPSPEAMASGDGESTAEVRARVLAARERQSKRLGPGRCNSELSPAETRRACALRPSATELLAEAHSRLGLSGRGYERVVRVARTVADLAAADRVSSDHVGETLGLRRRDSGVG